MKPSWGGLFAAILAFAGCMRNGPPPPLGPAPHPHYVLGAPYQADGHWYYPEENFAYDATGIAAIAPAPAHQALTADGERADPAALTAAMQAVQLPCVVSVTNLENGRQIALRVNDRGPANPARIIALSPRAALLLGMTGPARVHVQMDTAASHALAETIAGAPKLALAAAAPSAVTAEPLAPGGGAAGPARQIGLSGGGAELQAVPDRMPERILQLAPAPGALYLRAGSFGRFTYANVLAARLYGLGGTVLRSREGRSEVYEVRAGPFASIPQADAALRRALAAGVVDAHITVE